MTWGRRRPAVAERHPHPDPATEARLQRIIALRDSAARKAALSCQYAEEIGKLSAYFRNNAGFVSGEKAVERCRMSCCSAVRREEEISATHEEIARHIEELPDSDLAYLS